MEYINTFIALIHAAGQEPTLVIIAGFVGGCTFTTAGFKYFYVPRLDGSVNRSAAAKQSARDIMRSICSLREAARCQDQKTRRDKVEHCVFRLRLVAEIQTVIPFSFLRKRADAYAVSAELHAINGNTAAMEKAINKIIRLIA